MKIHTLELPAHTKIFISFQEVYKEAKVGWVSDDEPLHANKDMNRGMKCLNALLEGELSQQSSQCSCV
jgi:hypothetical protein